MIQIIPKRKVQISGNASLKDQINGIPFTSQGYEVWVTKVVDEKDEKKQRDKAISAWNMRDAGGAE